MWVHDAFKAAVRQEAQRMDSAFSHPRCGTISSYDPTNHAVKVMLQPENFESGWMPLDPIAIGNNFGIFLGPNIGDQVVVGFLEGNVDAPFILKRMHNDQDRPVSVQAGEYLIKHSSGNQLLFKADKSFTFTHGVSGGTHTWDSTGNVTIMTNNQAVTINAGTNNVKINGVIDLNS